MNSHSRNRGGKKKGDARDVLIKTLSPYKLEIISLFHEDVDSTALISKHRVHEFHACFQLMPQATISIENFRSKTTSVDRWDLPTPHH